MSSMWTLLLAVVVTLSVSSASYLSLSNTSSLVLRRLARSDDNERNQQSGGRASKVKMYEMHVLSRVQHRFANTLITSRVANNHNTSQEVSFSVVLPETAFISGFLMEVDGQVYKAYVKEKEEAKREYDHAVHSGLGAAHLAVSARDSNRFDVSVNVEPRKKITFNLTYDELLIRRLGTYNLAINLDPGQVVRDMRVDIHIKENRNLTILRVPELRSGNEIDADETTAANNLATIERLSPTEVHVSFHPSPDQQKNIGQRTQPSNNWAVTRETRQSTGLEGQFVVQYDVDRNMQAGEVLVDDGYFVHYFAPKDLLPLNKHVVFVLDVSGSMYGRKMVQMIEAMSAILDELREGDFFNVIVFSDSVLVWDLRSPTPMVTPAYYGHTFNNPEGSDTRASRTIPAFPASPELIAKAKGLVAQMHTVGGTNMYDALVAAVDVVHTAFQNMSDISSESKIDPTIIFLTDGEPTTGITDLERITKKAQELNKNPTCPLYSLAFGNDADLEFLKKLSLQNAGFARKIYEASDAALQLRNFYRQIASPLLANVTFAYTPEQVVEGTMTKTKFPTFLAGSEIVVAGKMNNANNLNTNEVFEANINGVSESGGRHFHIERPILEQELAIVETPRPSASPSSLERVWAYMTIQQLLEEDKASSSAVVDGGSDGPRRNPKQEALNLALKYSFVTPVTSLVVVKPNVSADIPNVNQDATLNIEDSQSGHSIAAGSSGGYSSSAFPGTSAMDSGALPSGIWSTSGAGQPPIHYSSGGAYGSHGMTVQAGGPPVFYGPPSPPSSSGSHGMYGPANPVGQLASYGQSGLIGIRGPQIPSWSSGSLATSGQAGSVGQQVPYGQPGLIGPPGSQIPSWSSGSPGNYGQKGAAGTPGSYGQSGLIGTPGPQIPSWSSGSSGNYGQVGTVGQPASYGQPGSIGTPGPQIPSWSSGSPGNYGQAGTAGQPASHGQSGLIGTSGPQIPSSSTGSLGFSRITLDQLQWLPAIRNGSRIQLPTGTFDLDLTFQHQANTIPCLGPDGTQGSCQHLQQCSMETFRTDINVYLYYFCAIGSYAGACCPSTMSVTP